MISQREKKSVFTMVFPLYYNPVVVCYIVFSLCYQNELCV